MAQDLNIYMETVASFVNDNDKLVTYKWLSKELEVHVNIAKDILQQYYDSQKDNVVATFLIKGQLKDGSLRVEVTRDADLNKAKQKFSHLDFKHIYSVQKALPDIELLATAGDGDVRFSAIKLEKCPLRAEEEKCTKPTEINVENTKTVEPKKVEKKIEEETQLKIEESSKINNKDEEKKKEKKEQHKKEEKDKSKNTKTDSTKHNSKANKKPIQSSQAGFKNLFGKVSTLKRPLIDSKSSNIKEDKRKSESPIKEVKEVEETVEKNNTKKVESQPEKPKAVKKNVPTKNIKSKKRARSPSKKEKETKRKRIFIASDSSEDEEMKSNHSEEEEEPEEIVQAPQNAFSRKSPTPEPVPTQSGKVKVRKVITQSYEDEDGYSLTKQVTVIEEVDAEPEPAPVPKKIEQSTKLKKQIPITNFFKRS